MIAGSYFDHQQILAPAREISILPLDSENKFFSQSTWVAFFVYAVDRAESKTALRLTPR